MAKEKKITQSTIGLVTHCCTLCHVLFIWPLDIERLDRLIESLMYLRTRLKKGRK